MSQAKLQCWNLLTRRCCIDNVETFISNWVIRVKVNPGIWTSGLEWGWRSSATVFTNNRVLWKKTISNLDRTINHCLGLSDVRQLWTVQTLLKLPKGAQEIVWMVEAHMKFPPDTQKVRYRPTSIPVRVLLGVIKELWKGKKGSGDLMLKCFPEIIPCMAQLWNICYCKPSSYSRDWALANSVTTAFH